MLYTIDPEVGKNFGGFEKTDCRPSVVTFEGLQPGHYCPANAVDFKTINVKIAGNVTEG